VLRDSRRSATSAAPTIPAPTTATSYGMAAHVLAPPPPLLLLLLLLLLLSVARCC
jgi:hypothetical protein